MSSHRVLCQPVAKHCIGSKEEPAGYTLYKDVASRNAHFQEIDRQYEVDHEKARRKGHCLEDGYTYLVAKGQPFYTLVEDDVFDKIDIIESGRKPHHFPDLKSPVKVP